MSQARVSIIFALVAFFVPSCATIVAGGPDEVALRTTPAGANVYRDGIPIGTTPCYVQLSRRQSSYQIRYHLPGYRPEERTVGAGFNGWVLGNVIFGGLIGIFIDAVSGNARKFPSEAPLVALIPESEAQGPLSEVVEDAGR